MKIWFGGYTKNTSKGIYAGDLVDDKVTAIDLKLPVQNATYFQLSKKNQLFTILKDSENAELGGIAFYDLNGETPILVDQALAAGAPPAYLGLDEEKELLYVANYHLAVLQVYSYSDNKLTLLSEVKHENEGHGPRPEQQSAHPHYFDVTPGGNLVSADLGLDRVDFYSFNDNKLTHLATYQNEAGFGSRHIAFHPTKLVMFVVGELSSQVNVVKFNEDNFDFEDLGTYSTLPESFDEFNGSAAIKISNDGKYLYVTNRGHDSLAVFSINQEDFSMNLIQLISVEGSFPRDFNWDKTETQVVAANQTTNNAAYFKRNSETGFLTLIQKDISVPEATRVLFTEK